MAETITDAQLIEQFAKKAMEEPAAVIHTQAPSESKVSLPGGFIEPNGELVTVAEVRELTGIDEELISKSGSTGKALNLILQRGLASVGSREATKEDLDMLLSGDRDAILIGIRRVTFGPYLDLFIRCTSCSAEQEVAVDLIDDVPVRTLKDPVYDRVWEMNLKNATVRVSLPTGVVHKKIMENADKTVSELNTMLLAGCVLSVNGSPSAGAQTVLKLGMGDRNKIVKEIVKRNPGPRLEEVVKVCKACGEDIQIPLGLTDLFLV